jgi:hypothetical protein
MNREQDMHESLSEKGASPRTSRSWQRPQVIRLQAGQAEAGFRLINPDGPLSSFS